LSKRYRASTVDDGILHSTNTRDPEESGGEYSLLGWTLEDYLGVHHSVRDLGIFDDAFGFEYDDTMGVPPLPTILGDAPRDSAPAVGNLESVSFDTVDVNTSFDYGHSQDDFQPFSTFSIDEFFNFEPTLNQTPISTSVEPLRTLSPSVSIPIALSTSPILTPPSSSESRHTSDSPESPASSTTPVIKLVIEPASSWRCEECNQTFAFQSRFEYVHGPSTIHTTD
jgi:hypothetical protein